MFHKEQCKKIMPANIMQYIQKTGGATDLISLFKNPNELLKIWRMIDFHKLHTTKLKILGAVFARVLIYVKDKISRPHVPYPLSIRQFLLESVADTVLKHAYLTIFCELFISNKYDQYFDISGLDLKLDDLFQSKER